MKKLFKEFEEEINKYTMENGCLDFYYIADDINFKNQVTVKDYYRIILVRNTEGLNAEILNEKLKELITKSLLNFSYDTFEDAIEILNEEYNLALELEESVFYDDLDYFKNGCIAYDKEKNLFDIAENWAEVVTTYLYKEKHGYIAAMQIEIQDYNLESPYTEVHIDELDETEEVEIEEETDDDYDDMDNDEDHSYPLDGITVMKEILIETTSVKKLDDNKYLIIISSKVPGHIDIASIADENELIGYLKNEAVNNVDKYMENINAKR